MLARNAGEAEKYRPGKTNLLGFFVGQAMKDLKGKGNPGALNALFKKKLGDRCLLALLACGRHAPCSCPRLPALRGRLQVGARAQAGLGAQCDASAVAGRRIGRVVQALREEYDALTHIQAVLGWYAATQGETLIRKLTYIGHDRLFHKTALEAVASAERQQGVAGNEALALRFLRRALTGEMVTLATAAFNDEFREAEAGATVSLPWRDKPVAYNDLSASSRRSPTRRSGRRPSPPMNAVRVRKLNPILERKEQAAQKAHGRRASPTTWRSRRICAA